jgi:outer membrane protein assembly factor BamB
MRKISQRRHLALICVSIMALLGVVACGDPPPSSSIFTQEPQQGSGEAIDLQSANQIHPLWAYQPDIVLSTALTSAQGIVYVSYDSNESKVGAGNNAGNITPTLRGGTLSVLDALDAPSGRRLWRFEAPELPDVAARPLVVNETVYFALSFHVCALNTQNGAVRWCTQVVDRTNDAEYIVDGEMTFANGLLFVGAYQTLIAVDATTGKRVWSVQTPMRSSHLAPGDGLIYVCAADGQITAFDTSAGQQVWRATQIPDTPFPNTFAPIPFLDEGTLYVLSGRKLVAYQGGRGDLLWQVSLNGGEHGGELFPPAPVFANVGGAPYMLALELNGSTLITPVTSKLVAYNLHTHQQMWSKQLPGHNGEALALSSDAVYVASETIDRAYPSPSDRHYWLTMMDLRSGQVARQLQNNDPSFRIGQLLGDGGRLFVLGNYANAGYGSRLFALGR